MMMMIMMMMGITIYKLAITIVITMMITIVATKIENQPKLQSTDSILFRSPHGGGLNSISKSNSNINKNNNNINSNNTNNNNTNNNKPLTAIATPTLLPNQTVREERGY